MSNFVSAKENILLRWRKSVEGLCFIKQLETLSFQISRNYMLSVFGFIHLTKKSVVCTAARKLEGLQASLEGLLAYSKNIVYPFTLYPFYISAKAPSPPPRYHTILKICSLLQVITYRSLDICVNELICYNLLGISSNIDYPYYT